MAQVGSEFIFNELSSCFAIEANILQVIVNQLVDQTMAMKLNKLTIQPIFKQIRKSCPKSNLPEMNILFKCCYVLILSLRESGLLYHDMEELFMDYPEFRGLPADELQKLLKFRNAMKVSLQLIEAKHHKGELLEICGRLSGKLVTTGGSQTTETKRRVLIYEREGGLEPEKAAGKGKKRKGEFGDVNLMKIKQEEFLAPSKKTCLDDPEHGSTFSRGFSSQHASNGVVIKAEPSLLPASVASFISQQLSHKFSTSDAATYQSIIEKTILQTTTNKELNKLTLRPILKDLRKLFPRKEIWSEMNILFKCCYVLILSLRDESLMWFEASQFLENYRAPEFANLTEEEVQKLLAFRNAMKLSLQLIEAKHHKGELLEIAGRLSGRVVTTGGGQTMDTTRCVMIYEQEGGNYSDKTAHKPMVVKHENVDSVFEFEGICRLGSMRTDDFFLSQFSQAEMKPASLDRVDSTASLFKSFSLQSQDPFEMFKGFSVGNNMLFDPLLSLPLPLSLNSVQETAVRVASPALSVKASVPVPVPATTCITVTSSTGVITADADTDIDTELDSIEVATEVDENEQHDEADFMPLDQEHQDASDLYEMFRSQSMPLESQEYKYGISGSGKTDSVSSVDMCAGIARLGSLPSISPEVFARVFTENEA